MYLTETPTEEKCRKPSFFLSSATGNIRFNEYGQKLGDGIFIMSTDDYLVKGKDLKYKGEGSV